MDLTKLGWNADLDQQFAPHHAKGLVPARVAVEDKHFFRVWTVDAELLAQVTGKCFHDARRSNSNLPKVGDWVAVRLVPSEEKAMIQAILPRRTQLCRKMIGRGGTEHILATNIDTAFLVTAADSSFDAARLEPMLAVAHESGARPVVLLNKIDLCADLDARLADATRVAGDALVLAACALTGRGVKQLAELIKPGDTAVFIGTSGVGKSSLINRLYGEDIQATVEVRANDAKGRHTTSWREMIFLPQGGVVIDTPGMREFHLWIATEGSKHAFPELDALSVRCHFPGCTHTHESRCAVLKALAAGTLPRERYDSFLKLQLEIRFLRAAEKTAAYQVRKRSDRVAGGTRLTGFLDCVLTDSPMVAAWGSVHPFLVKWVPLPSICATMDCAFSIVNISSAIFDCSAPDLDSCPDESLPEFAFIGRSNVGKSSLLNMLAGEQGLARVSTTPGFTKLINLFTMNKCWRLVDLPGYGFAHGPKQDRTRFSAAVSDYLENRPNLSLVFALIESIPVWRRKQSISSLWNGSCATPCPSSSSSPRPTK